MEQVGVEVEESAEEPSQAADARLDDTGFVDFNVTGTEVSGDFRCTDCGYGAVVQRVLPPCPMCGGTIWESRGPLGPRTG